MPGQDKTPDQLLGELSALLRLNYEPQDWGIVNADGDRIEEFMSCFETHDFSSTQKFQLAELILASANERLLDGGHLDTDALIRLIRRYPESFGAHLRYWRGLKDSREFPIAIRLQKF